MSAEAFNAFIDAAAAQRGNAIAQAVDDWWGQLFTQPFSTGNS